MYQQNMAAEVLSSSDRNDSHVPLPDRIERFVKQTQWWLQRSEASVTSREYPNLTAAQSVAASAELQRAAALLKEALQQWSAEKDAHSRTKELLRHAMAELQLEQRESFMASPSSAAAMRVDESYTNYTETCYAGSTQANSHPARQHTLMQHMLDDALERTPPHHVAARRSQPSPRAELTSSGTTHRQSCTSPFRSTVPRFRDVVPAGDHAFLPTKASRSVGVEYKTNADVERLLQGGSSEIMSTSTLAAQAAVQRLQRRLLQTSVDLPQQTSTPKRKGSVTTLFSPIVQ